jgi:thiamine pyrophosphate-dependent acetolactate synthase large subunit-like protein
MDLPIDVLFQPIQQARISWGSLGKPFPFRPGPHQEAITASCDLIRAAKRPALVTGSGGQSIEVISDSDIYFHDLTKADLHH